MTPALEVLVATRDRPVELATALAGLAAQDHPFDVLVSDQSDGPPSYDTAPARAMMRVLEGAGHRVRTGRHLPRRGIAEHRAALLARSGARRVLFLDDDVWLEPGTVARLDEAIGDLRCGLVGAPMVGLSHLDDERPDELAAFERWPGRPEPEDVRPGTPAWERWRLHNAANPVHLARRHVRPGSATSRTRSPGSRAVSSTRGRPWRPSAGSRSGATSPATPSARTSSRSNG
ncbi:glycosyltransferase [Pseudonocardia benzenivorans]